MRPVAPEVLRRERPRRSRRGEAWEGAAVLLPGFGAGPNQPILVALAQRLAPRMRSVCGALRAGRPSVGLVSEVGQLEDLLCRIEGPHVLIGRSFGGRVCLRLARRRAPMALVVLGFPIRPPGRQRPDDEAALAEVGCPTLVVQGDRDPLGPLSVLQPIAAANPQVELQVVKGAGHSFGRHEGLVLDLVAQWVFRTAGAGVQGLQTVTDSSKGLGGHA